MPPDPNNPSAIPVGDTAPAPQQPQRIIGGEEFLQDKFHKFAFKADSIYSSKLYAGLKPQNKKKIDDALYQKYSEVSHFMGRMPPAQQWWNSQTPQEKLAFIKNTQPSVTEPVSWGQHFNITMAHLAKGEITAAQSVKASMDQIFGGPEERAAARAGAVGWKPKENTFLKPQQEFVDKYIKMQQPTIENHLSARVNAGISGMVPDAILIGLTHKATGGMLAETGLTDYLKTVPIGRTALRLTQGALDGFTYSQLKRESGEESTSQAFQFAAWEGGLGALGWAGKTILGSTLDAAAASYAKLANIWGSRFVRRSIQNTVDKMEASKWEPTEQPVTEKETPESTERLSAQPKTKPSEATTKLVAVTKDPTLRKLDQHNADVLNTITRTVYGPNKVYQFLTKEQKAVVNGHLDQAIANGLNNPTRFDKFGIAQTIARSNTNLAKASPEVAQSDQQLQAITKQTTGTPVPTDTINKIQKEASAARSSGIIQGTEPTPTKVTGVITPKKVPEDVVTEGFEEHRNPNYGKGGYGPGAANIYDPSFTDDTFMRAMSMWPYFEGESEQDAIKYWQARTGRIRDKALANSIIKTYETMHPDPIYRDGVEAGIVEHLHKLYTTGYLDRFSGLQDKSKLGHIFQSGNYIADELRGEYDAPKTKWQRQLDKEYRAAVKSQQTKPAFEKTKAGKLKMGINKSAVIDMFAGQQYSNRNSITVVKELMQNAADAIRSLTPGAGRVKITHDVHLEDYELGKKLRNDPNFVNPAEGEHVFTVSDNGIGMSRNELFTVFSNLAESGKRKSETASGGFGLAKAAIFRIPNKLEVTTAKQLPNGTYELSKFTSTPESIVTSGVDVDTQIVRSTSDTNIHHGQTGTTIKAYFNTPEDESYVHDLTVGHIRDTLRSINFPGKIEAYDKYGNQLRNENYNFSTHQYETPDPVEHLETITMPNGSADIEIHIARGNEIDKFVKAMTGTQSVPLEIHNNGVYQFKKNYYPGGDVPTLNRIAINIKSRVPENHNDYPFTTNREALKGGDDPKANIERFVNNIVNEKLVQPARQKMTAGIAYAYNNLPTVPGTQVTFFDSGQRFTSEEMGQVINHPWTKKLASIYEKSVYRLRGDLVGEFLFGRKGGLEGEAASNIPGSRTEKIGLLFQESKQGVVHGVSLPNPSDPKKYAIFVNPFTRYDETPNTPLGYASRFAHTIVHELSHDVARGHNESFSRALAIALGRIRPDTYMDVVKELEEHYAAAGDFDKQKLSGEFKELLRIYKESRGREEVTPDIFKLED